MAGMISPGAHLVIGKDHVHAPVQVVFDRPVLADCSGNAFSLSWQAADIQTLFDTGFVLY